MKNNWRWEKFAQLYVQTGEQAKSYMQVYKCNNKVTAEKNSSRLMKNAEFCEVLCKYQKQIKEEHKGLSEQTINELSTVAFSDITDVADVDKELNVDIRVERLSELPPEIRRTIQSFDINKVTTGGKDNRVDRTNFKFKMHDKLGALNTLTKVLGINKKDDNQEDELENMTKQELWSLILRTLNELAAKRGDNIIPIKAIEGK